MTERAVDRPLEPAWYRSEQAAAAVPWLIVALAFALYVWDLSSNGYGNLYYAAAARSMTESWSNFFFVALDSEGFISVDKPPVFLWISAISVKLFGFTSLSLLLPSAIAGAATVWLVWSMVNRYFGFVAGAVAGLVLALTPITVAVHRLNLPDPFFILALVAAAACLLRSIEAKNWLWWTLGAGLLVGVAFNTKMLAGWVPGPALALAIVLGAQGSLTSTWRQWAPRLAVYGAAAFLTSVSWLIVVDSWPEDSRPYVGGSNNNTVFDLAFGYNGLDRVEGYAVPGRAPTGTGAGGVIAGDAGPLRMFDEANGGQIAWFFPFAVLGGFAAQAYWRKEPLKRAAIALWLGWLALFAVVFSLSEGLYHAYYTAALAPAVAALAGITSAVILKEAIASTAWRMAALGMFLATIAVQVAVASRFDGFFEWVLPLSGLTLLAGSFLLWGSGPARRTWLAPGLALALAGLLLLPLAWSVHEAANPPTNTTVPQAGPRIDGPANNVLGSQVADEGVTELRDWLVAHGDPTVRWQLVTPKVDYAQSLIAWYGMPVMVLGGFLGRDPTVTVEEFAEYIKDDEIRYVLLPIEVAGRPSNPNAVRRNPGTSRAIPDTRVNQIMALVRDTCEWVKVDADRYVWFKDQLYDCLGKGDSFSDPERSGSR